MRNHSIDTLKFICAAFVVAIHTEQPESAKTFIEPLIRCAVPIFFMISGYFTYGKAQLSSTLQKRLQHILKTFCWGFLFYFCGSILTNGYTTIYHLKGYLSFEVLALNVSPFGVPLWYLLAYIYVLVIMLFVEKYKLYKYLFYVTPLLLFASIVVGKYSNILINFDTNVFFSRNFLLTGLPFFTLGMLVKRVHTYTHTYTAAACSLIFYLLNILEVSYVKNLSSGDLYASTAFLSLSVFILFLNIKQPQDNILSKIGREYSLYIYVLHWGVKDIILMFINKNDYIYTHYSTLLVFSATLILVYILKKIKIIGKII